MGHRYANSSYNRTPSRAPELGVPVSAASPLSGPDDILADQPQLPGHVQHGAGRLLVSDVDHVPLVGDGGAALGPLLLHGLDEALPFRDFIGAGSEHFVDDRHVVGVDEVHSHVPDIFCPLGVGSQAVQVLYVEPAAGDGIGNSRSP